MRSVSDIAEVTETRLELPEGIPEGDREVFESAFNKHKIDRAARLAVKQEEIEREASALDGLDLRGLGDLVSTVPEGSVWLIDGLLHHQGSMMLAAAFKTGKTTWAMNMVHALTTGEPFLGEFRVPEPLKVAYFDLELGSRLARNWFIDIKPEYDNVMYCDLKGFGRKLDVRSDAVFNHLADVLRRNSIDVVVIDPLSALLSSLGINENSNEEVRPLLDRLDAVVAEAGCKGLVIIHHTGKDSTKGARGASAIQDWSSVNGYLTKPDNGPSKFQAKGRDVQVRSVELSYEPDTRRLSVEHSGAEGELFFSCRRGQKLTAAQVMNGLGVSKPTSIKLLQEHGWEVSEPSAGTKPATWEYLREIQDPFA